MRRRPNFAKMAARLFPDIADEPALTWQPMDYIREEVRRQGFNLGAQEGRDRVGWMAEAWARSEVASKSRRLPVVEDVIAIGQMVEPGMNRGGLRNGGVRVGDRVCPPWQDVPRLLAELTPQAARMDSLEFYRSLLMIHPFFDGNGRAGKIILNWHAGSWSAPFFPRADFWGAPIRNP